MHLTDYCQWFISLTKLMASEDKRHMAHVLWFPLADSGTAFLHLFHDITCPADSCPITNFLGVLFIGDDYHELTPDEAAAEFSTPAMKRWVRSTLTGESGTEECHVCLESMDDRIAQCDGTDAMVSARRTVACPGCSLAVCMGCWCKLEKCPVCPAVAPRETVSFIEPRYGPK